MDGRDISNHLLLRQHVAQLTWSVRSDNHLIDLLDLDLGIIKAPMGKPSGCNRGASRWS